jgi:predicted hydrocarbon binding protein
LDKPTCFIAAGILQEALKWVSGGNEFRVNESRCMATGDTVCEYVIQKEPLS